MRPRKWIRGTPIIDDGHNTLAVFTATAAAAVNFVNDSARDGC